MPLPTEAEPQAISIQPIYDVETLARCEQLQQTIWGMEPLDVVPANQLLVAAKNGGLVLGAFTPDGTLVGFSYGFVGLRRGRPMFWSHMTGVLPGLQHLALGYRLKFEQRRFVVAAGLTLMAWTYEPLESRNAYFNLRKLGARATRYHPDYYGPLTDTLNRGLPSDRLEVQWHLTSPEVNARAGGRPPPPTPDAASLPALLRVEPGPRGLPAPSNPATHGPVPALRLEVPAEWQPLKAADPALAARWRMAVREAFTHAFDQGYAATDFVRLSRDTGPCGAYVLTLARPAGQP